MKRLNLDTKGFQSGPTGRATPNHAEKMLIALLSHEHTHVSYY